MALSLLTRCTALGAIVPIAARTAHPAMLSVVTHRTLFTAPRFNFPLAKTSQKIGGKTIHSEASLDEGIEGKRTAPAKRDKPAKETDPSKKQLKREKQKRLKLPKRAPGPFVLFYTSFIKSQPRGVSLQDFQELTKRAGEVWRGYSMAEKQPFYDESEVRRVQANREREEFLRNISPSEMKQLNALREAQGKPKIRPAKKRLAGSPFFFFLKEFRDGPEGQTIMNEASPDKSGSILSAVAGAERWRSMSPEEKAPYSERARKAREELKAEQAN